MLQRKLNCSNSPCLYSKWGLILLLTFAYNMASAQQQVPYYDQHRDWEQIKFNWTNLDKEIGKKFKPFRSQGAPPNITRDYPYTYSGRAVSHAFSSSGDFYVGFSTGGLWRLDTYPQQDSLSWSLITNNVLLSQSIGAVVIDPSNDQHICVGTGSHENGNGRGVYYTNDGGVTWNLSTLPLGTQPPNYCYSFAWHNTSLYLATSNGLLLSNDKGITWDSVRINDIKGSVTDVVSFGSESVIVAAISGNGVYWLNQRGQWMMIKNGPTDWLIDIECSNNKIYALAGTDFYSGNTTSMSRLIDNTAPNGFNTLKVSSDNSVIYAGYASPGGIRKSIDQGITFGSDISGSQNVHVDQRGFAMDPNNKNNVFAICDGGVYRSKDAGNTWYNLNIGLQTFQCTDLASYSGAQQRLYVGQQDNGSQSIVDGLWTIGGGGDGSSNGFKLGDSLSVYDIRSAVVNLTLSETGRGIVYKGTYNVNINPTPGQPWTYLNSLVLNPKNTNVQYLSTDNGLYKTTNGGSSSPNTGWSVVQTAKNPRIPYVSYVAIDYLDTAKVYYLNNGRRSFSVYKSNNSGDNWSDPFPLTGQGYFSIVSSPNKLGRTFAVGGNKDSAIVMMSNDYSAPYNELNSELPPMQVFNIIETKKSSTGTIQRFIGNEMGIYWSFGDKGKWYKINNNLPNVQVRKLEFHDLTKSLRIATYGRGVWQIPCPIFRTTPISLNELSENLYCTTESISIEDSTTVSKPNQETTLIAQKGVSFSKGFSIDKGTKLSVFTFKEIE
ncbi:MAG: hypothetical protein GQ574_29455 [Crocinitomix sp.]|nr:hypothetical protein [Crocinitomix sp.]